MVSIRLDFGADGWEQKALQSLQAGAELYGVPWENLVKIKELAREEGLVLVARQESEGWRIFIRQRSTPQADTEEG